MHSSSLLLLLAFHHAPTVHGFAPLPTSSRITTTTTSTACAPSTALYSKKLERAQLERDWSNLMDNDWRYFRAQLVAREQAEQAKAELETATALMEARPIAGEQTHFIQQQDHAPPGRIGKILSKVARIVRRKQRDTTTTTAATTSTSSSAAADDDAVEIVDFTPTGHRVIDIDMTQVKHDDPFASTEELPVHLRPVPAAAKVSKHRWAHAIPDVEPGCVLLSTERVFGYLQKTVILVLDHCPEEGTTGLIINRPIDGNLLEAAGTTSTLDVSVKTAFGSSQASWGGPLNPESFSIIHGLGRVEGATNLCPGVFLGGCEELLASVHERGLDPSKVLFVKGHIAWDSDRLHTEMERGNWYVAAASSDLILRHAGAPVTEEDNTECLWADIMTCMGGKYADAARPPRPPF